MSIALERIIALDDPAKTLLLALSNGFYVKALFGTFYINLPC